MPQRFQNTDSAERRSCASGVAAGTKTSGRAAIRSHPPRGRPGPTETPPHAHQVADWYASLHLAPAPVHRGVDLHPELLLLLGQLLVDVEDGVFERLARVR